MGATHEGAENFDRRHREVSSICPPHVASFISDWRQALRSSSSPLAKFIDIFSLLAHGHSSETVPDFTAVDDQWTPYDVGNGAALVRPDGIVAWVAKCGELDKKHILDIALQKILSGLPATA
jgi:hypothetical protein